MPKKVWDIEDDQDKDKRPSLDELLEYWRRDLDFLSGVGIGLQNPGLNARVDAMRRNLKTLRQVLDNDAQH